MAESPLKIPRLRGSENYDIWEMRMEAVLTEKGYYDVMTSEQPPNPSIPEYLAEWENKRKRGLVYIRLGLEDGPLLQIRNINNPNNA